MTVEKKTIRSDIPGHQNLLAGHGSASSSTEERRMIVGRGIALNGDIAACDHLVIEGVVQAATFSARRLDIMEPGMFVGTAIIDDCIIAGRFEGRLSVAGRLTVKSTGSIHGEVEYGMIEAEAGAKIDGHMSVLAPRIVETKLPEVVVPAGDNIEPLFANDDAGETAADKKKSRAVYRRVVGA